MKDYGFIQLYNEAFVYKKHNGSVVMFLLDDILQMRNDIATISTMKVWLSHQFEMEDLGEAYYILGIKLLRNKSNKLIELNQAPYIDLCG